MNYDLASKTYDHTRRHSEAILERFAKQVSFTPTTAILDFGCGTGNYLNRLQLAFGCRCCGVEPSEGMRALATAKNGCLEIRPGDHRKVPFASESFDFAFLTDVIHHVPDLALMFSELCRVLKCGGCLCVVTESHEQIQSRFYNRYFPSLAANEQRRYPKVDCIVQSAVAAGFRYETTAILPAMAPATINEEFLKNVEEKNYSMFRLLDGTEYVAGLAKLKQDLGRTFEPAGAGDSLIWLRRPAQLSPQRFSHQRQRDSHSTEPANGGPAAAVANSEATGK